MFVPFSFFSTQLPPVPRPTGSYFFDSTTLLSWPSSTTGYTLYTDGFTNFNDGYTTSSILSISSFTMNQTSSNQIYVSTNGYITLGAGRDDVTGGPNILRGLATIVGQPSDLWLSPGLVMTDGDTQNLYYVTGSNDSKSYIKFITYCGFVDDIYDPMSYLLNLYIDNTNQWVETRVKYGGNGPAGPYNSPSVAQDASPISKVWRGDLTGRNWVYLGTGSVYTN